MKANDDSCQSLTDILAQLQDNDEKSDDSSFNFDDDSSSDEVSDDEDDYTMEDMFEESVNMHELLPLPNENDPKFPQEDEKYFRKKKYVRNDKYELRWFFSPQH